MADTIFHLQPWDPKIREAAGDVIHKIYGVAPELEVLFMGAAALGLPGKNDIDLDILCVKADIAKYTEKLIPILGQPKEKKDNLTAWDVTFEGYEIDAILSDPETSHVPLQRIRFEKLKSNKVLLDEYRDLKVASDGLPYAEYEQRKKEFLETRVYSSAALAASKQSQISDEQVEALLKVSNVEAILKHKQKRPTSLLITVLVLIVLVVVATYAVGYLKHGTKSNPTSSLSGSNQSMSSGQTQSVTNQVNQDVKTCSNPVNASLVC